MLWKDKRSRLHVLDFEFSIFLLWIQSNVNFKFILKWSWLCPVSFFLFFFYFLYHFLFFYFLCSGMTSKEFGSLMLMKWWATMTSPTSQILVRHRLWWPQTASHLHVILGLRVDHIGTGGHNFHLWLAPSRCDPHSYKYLLRSLSCNWCMLRGLSC